MSKKQKIQSNALQVLDILKPLAGKTMLEEYKHRSPFELLIMTLLSARTKDSTVIPIALNIFQTHNTPEHFLTLTEQQIQNMIYGIGFHRTKAKHIKQLSQILIQKYKSQVPGTMGELLELPGVGRKTASCILSYVFNVPAIAVDIHVHRITNTTRLNWINTKTPEQSEAALKQLIPKQRWNQINSLIVDHGQRICHPRSPNCNECAITNFCNYKKSKSSKI